MPTSKNENRHSVVRMMYLKFSKFSRHKEMFAIWTPLNVCTIALFDLVYQTEVLRTPKLMDATAGTRRLSTQPTQQG